MLGRVEFHPPASASRVPGTTGTTGHCARLPPGTAIDPVVCQSSNGLSVSGWKELEPSADTAQFVLPLLLRLFL